MNKDLRITGDALLFSLEYMHDDIEIENSAGSAKKGLALRIVNTSTVMGCMIILLRGANASNWLSAAGKLVVHSNMAHARVYSDAWPAIASPPVSNLHACTLMLLLFKSTSPQ